MGNHEQGLIDSEPCLATQTSDQEQDAVTPEPSTKAIRKRFDFRKESIQELILLRALGEHQPFLARHGAAGTTWDKVVDYLHDSDQKERQERPFFTNVKRRTCQLAWERIYEEQKAHEAYITSATEIVAEGDETERRVLMEELYSLKNSSVQAADDQRSAKTRQRRSNIEERRMGELLLESAESTEPRSRNDQSESDGGNRSSNRHGEKRIALQQLQQQQQEEDAISHVKDQISIMEQQLLLQREDIERKKEKARKQEERERDKDAREHAKELRDREWEREKLREAARREDERHRRQHEMEKRRHKEFMDIFRQQANTNQLLTQLMLNMHQNSNRDSFVRPNTRQPSEDGNQRND